MACISCFYKKLSKRDKILFWVSGAFSFHVFAWTVFSVVGILTSSVGKEVENTIDALSTTTEAQVEVIGIDTPELWSTDLQKYIPPKRIMLAGGIPVDLEDDRTCLVVNAYFEARGENESGRILNIMSVKNRMKQYGYSSVCDTVLHLKEDRNGWWKKFSAHYSWLTDGTVTDKIGQTKADLKALNEIIDLVGKYYDIDKTGNPVFDKVTHYHTKSSRPWWSRAKDMKYLGTVDNHVAYAGW